MLLGVPWHLQPHPHWQLLWEVLLGDGSQGVLEGDMLTWVHEGRCFCTTAACGTEICLYGKPIMGGGNWQPWLKDEEGKHQDENRDKNRWERIGKVYL